MTDKERIKYLEAEIAKYIMWYNSVMEYGVTKNADHKCQDCGGPVSRGLCCAWCGSTGPS